MRAFTWIIDTIYDLFEYLLMLLIIGLAIVVIIWRLQLLFGTNIEFLAKGSQVVDTVSEKLDSSSLVGESVDVVIPAGTSAEGIGNILFEYGLIADKEAFAKDFGLALGAKELPSGNFKFTIGQNSEEIINTLLK